VSAEREYPFDPDDFSDFELLDLSEMPAAAPASGNGHSPEGVKRIDAGPGLDPDAADAEKEPAPPAGRRVLAFEPADEFLARLEAQGEPGWLVNDLVPDDAIAVWHGRPRSMKSLAALEMNLSCATDSPAFGSERFATSTRGGSVLYLTEEDGERLIASRLKLMLAARQLDRAPKRLRILSRPGWNLERPEDQGAVLAAIREASPAPTLLTVDPARGSMPALDKGPSDAAGAIRFLRQVQRETSIRSVLVLHHDIKPARDGKDDRARAERASGGAVFSIADCPVNFERVTDRVCSAFPSAYKVGADPKAFRIEWESGTPPGEPFRGFLRAHATTTDERTEEVARVDVALRQVLEAAASWMKTAELLEATKGGKGSRQDKLAALKRLEERGQVSSRQAGRGLEWRLQLGA
jgi:hypothetical protein